MRFLPLLALTATSANALMSTIVKAYAQPNCNFDGVEADDQSAMHEYYMIPYQCHNTKHIDMKSFYLTMTHGAKKAEKKGCYLIMFSDYKCRKPISQSHPFHQKPYECENVAEGIEVGSVRYHCPGSFRRKRDWPEALHEAEILNFEEPEGA